MLDPASFVSTPAPGRDCGTCTLCCKVYEVPAVASPIGQWCRHCLPGRGCGIHATRPDHCRAFHCLWMTTTFLGPDWKPEKAKFVLSVDPATRALLAQVDPGAPKSWLREPYYAQFKRWAREGLTDRRFVSGCGNHLAPLVLPDRDVAIGELTRDMRLVVKPTADGTMQVEKVAAR